MSDSYKEILSRADLHFEEVRRRIGDHPESLFLD